MLPLPPPVVSPYVIGANRGKYSVQVDCCITVSHRFPVRAAQQLHVRRTRPALFHTPPSLPKVQRGESRSITGIAALSGSTQLTVDRRP